MRGVHTLQKRMGVDGVEKRSSLTKIVDDTMV